MTKWYAKWKATPDRDSSFHGNHQPSIYNQLHIQRGHVA